uniref:UDP-glucuronosyltransferase n=1 Tax=Panagrolaimus sp. ES5 TaxID=591445 RepID=A0AC34FTA9_9BILA
MIVVCFVNAGKVGIFLSTNSNSQLVFGYRLAEILSKHHEVVMIRAEYNPKTRSFKSPLTNVREIYLEVFNSSAQFDDFANHERLMFFNEPTISIMWKMAVKFQELYLSGCENMLSNKKFLMDIENENFDIIFTHHYDICPFAVMQHAKVPKWIYTMSSPIIEMVFRTFGIPSPPSTVPGIFTNTTNQLTFNERAYNTLTTTLSYGMAQLYFRNYDKIIRQQLGSNFPSIKSLIRKSKLIFVNDFEFLEYPRPLSSAVINIGGIGIDTSKPLENEFKTFVEESYKPVVVISFGTVADPKVFPEEWKNAFVQLFASNLHINFIWYFEDPALKLPKNVLMQKWIPQTSILANPKTVAFISHCGYNGLQEAILTTTPMICIPLFGDQPRNAKLVELKNIGTYFSKMRLSGDLLTETLKKTLNNKSYHKSLLNLRSLLLDRPFNSSELLLRWTDFTIKHDFDFTFPDVGFVEFYNLDIFVPLGFISVIILSFTIKFFFNLYYWSCVTMAFRDKQKLQ